jgi:beta-mannosidase
MLARQNVELVFEGLDTACTIFLNGQRIAAPDNMFRQWRLDVKKALKPGDNELDIVFPAPMKAAEAVAEKDPWAKRAA